MKTSPAPKAKAKPVAKTKPAAKAPAKSRPSRPAAKAPRRARAIGLGEFTMPRSVLAAPGGMDALARKLGEALSRSLGQPAHDIPETQDEMRIRHAFERVVKLQRVIALCQAALRSPEMEAEGGRVVAQIETAEDETHGVPLRASLLLPALRAAMEEEASIVIGALTPYARTAGTA